MARSLTPLGAIVRGVIAGAAGTLAMDLVWYRRHRRSGGTDTFAEWELSAGTSSYEEAGPPAQVGKRVVEAFLQRELPDESASGMNNAVHWGTGLAWGAVHAVLFAPVSRVRQPLLGALTGSIAWLTGYLALAPAGIYRPIWEYDRETLWKDLSAHLVFGPTVGLVFALLRGRGPRPDPRPSSSRWGDR